MSRLSSDLIPTSISYRSKFNFQRGNPMNCKYHPVGSIGLQDVRIATHMDPRMEPSQN